MGAPGRPKPPFLLAVTEQKYTERSEGLLFKANSLSPRLPVAWRWANHPRSMATVAVGGLDPHPCLVDPERVSAFAPQLEEVDHPRRRARLAHRFAADHHIGTPAVLGQGSRLLCKSHHHTFRTIHAPHRIAPQAAVGGHAMTWPRPRRRFLPHPPQPRLAAVGRRPHGRQGERTVVGANRQQLAAVVNQHMRRFDQRHGGNAGCQRQAAP